MPGFSFLVTAEVTVRHSLLSWEALCGVRPTFTSQGEVSCVSVPVATQGPQVSPRLALQFWGTTGASYDHTCTDAGVQAPDGAIPP